MTHYMELLQQNQPWNLIIFMAIPVILAEIIAITQLFVLLYRLETGWVRQLNRIAGIIVGPYFVGVFAYLLVTAVVPLTTSGGWRGVGDIIAVGFYLLGVVPLVGISLLEYGLIGKKGGLEHNLFLHATFVGVFLAVAHIAMIFGMLDPTLLGWAAGGM